MAGECLASGGARRGTLLVAVGRCGDAQRFHGREPLHRLPHRVTVYLLEHLVVFDARQLHPQALRTDGLVLRVHDDPLHLERPTRNDGLSGWQPQADVSVGDVNNERKPARDGPRARLRDGGGATGRVKIGARRVFPLLLGSRGRRNRDGAESAATTRGGPVHRPSEG